MKYFALSLCLFCATYIYAQESTHQIIHLTPEQLTTPHSIIYDANENVLDYFDSDKLQSDWLNIPIAANPFLAFSAAWVTPENEIDKSQKYFRFANEDEVSPWQLLKADRHYVPEHGREVSTLIFAEKKWNKIQIQFAEPILNLSLIELHFFNPGNSEAITINTPTRQQDEICPCPQPEFLDRAGWCPTGDCTEHPNPVFTEVTHLIVHHAASTNASSNWSGVVRSIWDYHVNTNGWSDIGYNWLIDPDGVVYEGRGDNILGAHFCSNNGGTVGICLLGDFTNTTPATTALERLQEFLAWKACDAGIAPEASGFHASSNQNLPLISGHRDGCNTECPGNQFYPMMPVVRSAVKEHQETACTTVSIEQTTNRQEEEVEVFPNPGSGPLTLIWKGDYRGKVKIELYDSGMARLLRTWELDKEEQNQQELLDCGPLPTGLYFLKINRENKMGVWKVIRN